MHDILFFSIFQSFLISSDGTLLGSKNIYCGKNTAIIRCPPCRVTALQVVRTSFLGPRPCLFPPPPPPTVLQRLIFLYRSLRFSDRNSIIDCNFDNTWRVFGVRLIDKVARTLFHSLLLFLLR